MQSSGHEFNGHSASSAGHRPFTILAGYNATDYNTLDAGHRPCNLVNTKSLVTVLQVQGIGHTLHQLVIELLTTKPQM